MQHAYALFICFQVDSVLNKIYYDTFKFTLLAPCDVSAWANRVIINSGNVRPQDIS